VVESLSLETGYVELRFFIVFLSPSSKCWNSTLKQAMAASFHIFSTPLTTIIPSPDATQPMQLK